MEKPHNQVTLRRMLNSAETMWDRYEFMVHALLGQANDTHWQSPDVLMRLGLAMEGLERATSNLLRTQDAADTRGLKRASDEDEELGEVIPMRNEDDAG